MNEDVAARAQTQQNLAPGFRFQIEHDAALVAVEVHEERAHARVARRKRVAHDVALGRLDFDHARAKVGEDARRQRTHDHAAQIQHPHAGQGSMSAFHERSFDAPACASRKVASVASK